PTPMKPMTGSGTGPVKRPSASFPAVADAPRRAAPAQSSDPPTTGPVAAAPMIAQHDLRLVKPSPEELAALAEHNDLGDAERRLILAIARLVESRADAYALLGVPAQTDVRDLKRAYFQLSKEIHPDRYYGRKLGTFGDRMALVFEACARAYARLTGGERARASSPAAQDDDQPQTQQDYAAELFDRACNVEIGGDALGAMKLFAAAIRVDPQLRYLRRAANCALIAGQPRTALEYAKKAQMQAPTDPSAARLLATAFRAAGKLSDAEDVLVMAMALKTENDALAAELRHDLAEVRRLLAAP
ncbi:MAG: DnaJ domain-containing protein, partial [Deltaproteobacteria bacterium]|nr:DnaJ domain-containing protein [Deltaproteobacteria bacterium]